MSNKEPVFKNRFLAALAGKLSGRMGAVTLAWGIFTYWQGSEFFASFNPAQSQFGYDNQLGPFFIALNFWGLVAALVLAGMVLNLVRWGNGKRLIFGTTAFGLIVGRLTVGLFSSLMFFMLYQGAAVYLTTPLLLFLVGLFTIFIIGIAAGGFFAFIVAVPVTIFNQILAFENNIRIYRYQARGLTGYIVRFTYWLRSEPKPVAPPDDSKGARFATMPEIHALHKPADPKAMAFGHIGNPVMLATEKHVLIMASTRSGKGVTLIIPHLLRYSGSAFVLDPKGENAKATGRRRGQLNGKVHYLDPFGISGKPQSRFNPLARFTPENMEAESKALAAALFVIGERERDHWTAAGQQLLAAIILYVFVSTDFPPDKKDLSTVRHILLGGIDQALEAMMLIDDADGLLRDLAFSFINTPEKERGSIISTAQRQTEILDNPSMIACLAATGPGPEVDFADWHRGTMTVFLCLSAPKFPTFNRWLRLVLTSALDEMTDRLDPPALPVCFMLDELATLGHLTAVENAVGLAAGYGIQLVTVFQDVAQMRDLYKGRWASFVGNAGVRVLFNLDDFETADYWSKTIGGRLFETRNTQQDIYGLSNSASVGEAMRPLLPPDQLMLDFASGKMLVLAQGAHPITTDRVAYWSDKRFDGQWDDPRIATPKPKLAVPSPAAPPQPAPKPDESEITPAMRDFIAKRTREELWLLANAKPLGSRDDDGR